MIESLLPKSSFTGLDGIAHLATGGESPMLCTHLDAVQQFMRDKSQGEPSRQLQEAVMEEARQRCATLFKVPARDLTFLSSATEGINVLCYGLKWEAGDNVVVADVEFPSGILPWTKLKRLGVDIRVVKHKQWVISEQDVLAQVDDRTKVVAMSQVSMFTGQHMDVAMLSKSIRDAGAIFLMDATHAAGVVPVDANHADIMVSSCYKWMLGTHGTAVFYYNRERMASLSPPFRCIWPGNDDTNRRSSPRRQYQFYGIECRFSALHSGKKRRAGLGSLWSVRTRQGFCSCPQ